VPEQLRYHTELDPEGERDRFRSKERTVDEDPDPDGEMAAREVAQLVASAVARERAKWAAELQTVRAELAALKATTGEEIARGQAAFNAGEPCDSDVAKAGLGFAAGYWYSKAREAELHTEVLAELVAERDKLAAELARVAPVLAMHALCGYRPERPLVRDDWSEPA
jgi:GAF domain-containing protein